MSHQEAKWIEQPASIILVAAVGVLGAICIAAASVLAILGIKYRRAKRASRRVEMSAFQ